jgi:NAD(P)-dependent dehydrogenase (short-subunit alcohol dehydrogenase family)
MTKAFSLEGRAALVTGSSQGIGHGVAMGLRDAGARVVFHGLQPKGEASEVPEDAAYVPCDLLNSTAPASLIDQSFAAEPSLDMLVCNAGSFFDYPVMEMTRERWDRTMALNVTAAFFLAQAFTRQLVERKRSGSIVITSSTNGFQAEADSVAYDSSKGALVMMTRSLAVSLAPFGIRVNGIAPGLIRTPLTSTWMEPRAADLLKHYEKKILLGHVGVPQDCAGAVVFLCSAAARYITGEIIVIDGGLTVSQIGQM